MHPTSLPSHYGVGDLGENAYTFIDEAAKAGVGLWQVLPLGPTGFGDSPYAARSTFAGNEILIDLKSLCMDGYLEIEDLLIPEVVTERVDYGKAKQVKMPLLRKAAKAFLENMSDEEKLEWQFFEEEKGWWLDDYALYQSLCDEYNDSRWFYAWPEELRDRNAKALKEATAKHAEDIEIWKALQFFFFKQWGELKQYANENGIEIIGDIPIFVAPDSVDAWTNRKLLKINAQGEQEASSGVPPDAFSATGQLWGNPLYKWKEHEKDGFKWWISRMKETLVMCDIVRIDHFRGFEACWEVPAGEDTAMNGKWVKSPGEKLLKAMKEALGDDLPVIAEDLGIITPEVEALRDEFGFPGMKILEFAFYKNSKGEFDAANPYLPHNMIENSVAYTGTHDNNTVKGWYDEMDDEGRDFVRRYFECGDADVPRAMLRFLFMSNAMWAIVPMQDVLMLGAEARMNVPSTCGSSNWSWFMKKEDLKSPNWGHIAYFNKLYGRC